MIAIPLLDNESVLKNPIPPVSNLRILVIAECMKALGYVNRFGYGILRAQDTLRKNGSADAEFEIND